MDDTVPLFQQTLTPLGRDVVPAGEDDFEDLVRAYREKLRPGLGPVYVKGMVTMAECRAAILAARAEGCFPVWVSWSCDEDGETSAGVEILAALIVCQGMGAAAFGLRCPGDCEAELLGRLVRYAIVPRFVVRGEAVSLQPYIRRERDPDVIPCAAGGAPCFVTRTVDVGEDIECAPDLLERIIEAEDDPVGAVKIVINEPDDVDIFAREQYAVQKALCLWADVPELLEAALRAFQGRAFYDGTGDLEPEDLDRLCEVYGLIIL